MAAATVESLELRISNKADGVASGIREITNALKEMKSATHSTGLDTVVNQLNALNAALRRTRALTNRQINIPVNTGGVSRASNSVAQKTSAPVSKSLVAAQNYSVGSQETGKVTELADKAQKASAEIAKLKSKVEDLDKASKKSASGLAKVADMFKRILLYRAIRGIISAITQALKEGIDNLYQWSQLNEGTFAHSMDTLATCATNAKNALAVAFAPAINAIVPIVQVATNAIVTLGNAISWLFAKLKGAATYTRVNTDYMTQYKEAATSAGGAAGKAAKEMQRTILGFDEINKLNGATGGSGGGGGGGSGGVGGGYNDMFELANVDDAWAEASQKIQAAVEKIRSKVDEFLDQHPKLKKVVGPTLKYVREAWGVLTQNIVGNADFVNSKYKSINSECKKMGDGVTAETKSFTEKTKSMIVSWGDAVAGKSSSSMGTMYDKIHGTTSNALHEVKDFVTETLRQLGLLSDGANDNLSEVGQEFDKTLEKIEGFTESSTASGKLWAKEFAKSSQEGAKAQATNIYNGLSNSSGNISTWSGTTSSNMDAWATLTSGSIAGWAKNFVSNVAKACQEAYNNIKNFANSTGQKTNLASYSSNSNVSTSTYNGSGGKGNWQSQQKLTLYAQGGFPIPGDLFIANERGPELVGSMNNRPAVANNQQIIEGIAQGVARAMMTQEALLREQNDLLRNRGDVVVSTGSLVDAFGRMNRRSGTTVVPVGG